jgi:purine-binding chemotaxis protein CheW
MLRHLIFSVDHVLCALPLTGTHIVLRMVRIIPPSDKIHGLAGTVNVHGELLPVYSVRSLFGLPDRPPRLTDRLVVADAGGKSIALWVEEAHVTQENPVLPPHTVILEKGREVVPGISLTDGGMFIIGDLLHFISPENATAVREAFASGTEGKGSGHA